MTWLVRLSSPRFWRSPRVADPLRTAVPPEPERTTVVVPVRDNPVGIARLLEWWTTTAAPERGARLIIVDDGSLVPLAPQPPQLESVDVLRTPGLGPAAARNIGWRAARTPWIAFLDSDCVPDDGWTSGFAEGWSDEIAIQGRVRAMAGDRVSRFYDSQQVLRPMGWTSDGRPGYLISANVLVWREALEAVGGFDERFKLAAAEDVDLGLRLARRGLFRWSAAACVAHDFEPSVAALWRRFHRYGRGNRLLAEVHPNLGPSWFRPRPFLPNQVSPTNIALAAVALMALASGWRNQRRIAHEKGRTTRSGTPAVSAGGLSSYSSE